MSEPWTIDSIAHALPHAENRQAFWRALNLAPVDRLPDVVAKWVEFVERWEASKPEIERLRQYALAHDGELPPEHQETEESAAAFEEWREQMRALREGRNAA